MSGADAVVYLVRHGRTSLNAADQLRGRLDPGLDHEGQREATRLGQALADVPMAVVLTSPRRRARQTADPIAASTGVPIHAIDDLDDRDYGQWAGTSRAEIVDRFGSVDAAPGVETTASVRERTLAVLHTAVTTWAPRPFVIVAHDAVNRELLAALVPQLGRPETIDQHTGCWNRLERHDGTWSAPQLDVAP